MRARANSISLSERLSCRCSSLIAQGTASVERSRWVRQAVQHPSKQVIHCVHNLQLGVPSCLSSFNIMFPEILIFLTTTSFSYLPRLLLTHRCWLPSSTLALRSTPRYRYSFFHRAVLTFEPSNSNLMDVKWSRARPLVFAAVVSNPCTTA